ncbi:hypothetical protein LOTGIDRAFT_154253 [Lottia gigantea]|uniref:Kazal-like domain-containing protein n=1 Tax=Lottia gigantea TaxID=225164 RepID=V3ZXN6_LOTGI|nr:hypothetical protein LOTGIDRAFT_154253 [Lottia gigantea]ESO89167.1 hypothetical protein LOTGIDRAFT_154253 [Lottia gigantea]
MKFIDIIAGFLLCVLGVCDSKPSIYSIQKRLKNLQSAANKNHEKTMFSMRYTGSDLTSDSGRGDSVLQSENDKNEYIKKILAQRHSHRPLVKINHQEVADGEGLDEYVVNRLMKEHRQLKHKRACRGVERRLKTLKCPSDRSICLLDEMVCNDYPDCPNGEDENPAVCLIHDWASRWFSKIQYYLIPTNDI